MGMYIVCLSRSRDGYVHSMLSRSRDGYVHNMPI
jgi:hypothetical protein